MRNSGQWRQRLVMEALGNGGGLGVEPAVVTRWRRAERQRIFAPPISSKAKCLSLLPTLLDANLAMHSGQQEALLLLPSVVGLSLRRHTLNSTGNLYHGFPVELNSKKNF
jgi:hypothetical protein